MMQRCPILLFSCLVALFFSDPYQVLAGAWGQEQGRLFVSLQTYFYTTSRYYDRHGDVHDRGGTFNKYEINPYIEYGLSTNDTLVVNLFYDWLRDDASGTKKSNSGLADMELGWQHRLYRGENGVLALQGLAIVPTGYDIADDPRLGYDRFGLELSLLYGRPFKLADRYGFIDLRLGGRQYFGYPSTQVRAMLTIGYDFIEKWQLLASAELHYDLDNGSDMLLGPNVLIQPNYRLLKLTAAVRYRLTGNISLLAAGYGHAWGEETGRGGGCYVSLWYTY